MSDASSALPRASTFDIRVRAPARRALDFVGIAFETWSGAFGMIVLVLIVVVAALSPWIVPYDPIANHFSAGGQLKRLEPPSAAHWLGTTYYGLDVLSQVIDGTRIVLVVGITCAFFIAIIGTNIGLLAGYYGGRVDAALMRITGLAFGIPLHSLRRGPGGAARPFAVEHDPHHLAADVAHDRARDPLAGAVAARARLRQGGEDRRAPRTFASSTCTSFRTCCR